MSVDVFCEGDIGFEAASCVVVEADGRTGIDIRGAPLPKVTVGLEEIVFETTAPVGAAEDA